jgi:hypothetical protein
MIIAMFTRRRAACQYQSLFSLHSRDLPADPALAKSPSLTLQKRCVHSFVSYQHCKANFSGLQGDPTAAGPTPTLPAVL